MKDDNQSEPFIAHRKEYNGKFTDQSVENHLRETTELAENFCQSAFLGKMGVCGRAMA
jgi:hypothetical protein